MGNVYSVIAEVKSVTGPEGEGREARRTRCIGGGQVRTAGSKPRDEKAKRSKSKDSLQWIFIKAFW